MIVFFKTNHFRSFQIEDKVLETAISEGFFDVKEYNRGKKIVRCLLCFTKKISIITVVK